VHVADQPAVVHVTPDALDGVEGHVGGRDVMHRENDARHDLDGEAEGEDAAEGPEVVEIARRREVDELTMHHAHDRQSLVHPVLETGAGLVCGVVLSHGECEAFSRS